MDLIQSASNPTTVPIQPDDCPHTVRGPVRRQSVSSTASGTGWDWMHEPAAAADGVIQSHPVPTESRREVECVTNTFCELTSLSNTTLLPQGKVNGDSTIINHTVL